MLESFNTNSEFKYQKLTEEEKKSRGILGRLVGIIADFKNATRNGRRYTEELWDKTFEDPIVKEKLVNRCILGELGHPADRQDIDIEKVAICLAEMPKKGNDGKIHGVFDILDTPNGRILKTLCDYGCNIGVSSRGGGDTYEDDFGEETVDSGTYEFECFDAVLLPAVKTARPAYVTESFDKHKKTLKTALLEQLDTSSDEERRVMENTLNDLNIDYSTDADVASESVDNIEENKDEEANNYSGSDIVIELQEALQKQQELEFQVKSLQERLSVCYTKESRYSDRLEKSNSKVSELTEDNKKLQEQLDTVTQEKSSLTEDVVTLTESLTSVKKDLEDATTSLSTYRERFAILQEKLQKSKQSKIVMTEDISSKDSQVQKLTEQLQEMKIATDKQIELAATQKQELENKSKKLVEELAELKKDNQILKSQNAAKLEKAQQLVEKYKTIAKVAVDKYIDIQALKLGVSKNDIKSKLTESCSFKDIDKVCEDLQCYKVNISSLPFTTMMDKKPRKMTIKESKSSILNSDDSSYIVDDDIDATLLNFTN